MDESTTQDTFEATESAPENESAEAKPSGVQRRIDEVVAERYAIERRYQAEVAKLQAQNLALQQQQLRAMQQYQAPQENVDPDFQRQARAALLPEIQAQQAELLNLRRERQQEQLEAAIANDPPEVQNYARKCFTTWLEQGKTGWAPLDARVHALGMVAAIAPKDKRPKVKADVLVGESAPPPSAPPAKTKDGKPADFDKWSHGRKAAWFEKQWAGKG